MYPKIFISRIDSRSQVVIANKEQEAGLPQEYLPQLASLAQGEAMLSPEYDSVLAARGQLEKERTAFAEEMAAGHKALADERAALTAGYKASIEQLEADRKAWEDSKDASDPGIAPSDDMPAKRGPGRPPKES